MLKHLACAFAIALAACAGNAPPAGPDAGPALKNVAFGGVCTVASDMSTECASGVCTDTINMLPTPVCSQKCTVLGGTDPTCPNGSMGQKCNMKGYCRPEPATLYSSVALTIT